MRTDTLGPGDLVSPFTLLPYGEAKGPVSWQPGRVTVFSFCALWCDTWREQSARLTAVRRRLAGLPIDYRIISVDGRWAERYTNGGTTDTGVLLDSGGRLSASLGIRAVPWTLVVDSNGVICLARQGIVRSEELEQTLRRIATTKNGSSTDATGREIYLTFDDFPTVLPGARVSPDEELLDVLRAGRTPATFFCIGEHLTHPAGAAAARRAVREGHSLQMHGWNHNAARPDLPRCIAILRKISHGPSPAFYRPPGGAALLLADGVTPAEPPRPVISPYDHLRPGAPELARRVLFAARPGAVIQLHAGVPETREILPGLFASLRRRGLDFALLPSL